MLTIFLILCSQDTIIIRVADFPPQYYRNSNNEWTGLDVELARTLVETAGFTPEFVVLPWSRALLEIEQGEIHMMMNLSINEERKEVLFFIGPERINKTILVVKNGDENLKIDSIPDLLKIATEKGKKFGIQRDAFYSEEFNNLLKDNNFAVNFNFVPEARLNPKMTSAGRILGFFEDSNSVKYQLVHNPDYKDLAIHPFVLSTQEVYFGISKKGVSDETLQKLEQTFDELERDGILEEIRNRKWQ